MNAEMDDNETFQAQRGREQSGRQSCLLLRGKESKMLLQNKSCLSQKFGSDLFTKKQESNFSINLSTAVNISWIV